MLMKYRKLHLLAVAIAAIVLKPRNGDVVRTVLGRYATRAACIMPN
jgi:hypothetical protein